MEYVPQQRALGHRLAVDAVVRRHHGPDAGLTDDGLERRQVQLAQRPLADADVRGHPLGLGVVGDEMLDGGADAAVLEPAHVAHPDPRGQERILAEALEMPAGVGGAVEVDGRREHDVDALAPGLGRKQAAQLLDELLVPRRRQRGRRRHVRRGVTLVPPFAAPACGTVGDDRATEPHGRLGVQRPEVRAGEQADLLLWRQRGDASGQLGLVEGGRGNGRLGHTEAFSTGRPTRGPSVVRPS